MTGFVCILERSGGAAARHEIDRLAAPLAMSGAKVSTFVRGPVGIAVLHRGGRAMYRRHGPVEDPETGRVVAVAGRFAPVAREPAAGQADTPASPCEPVACAALALSRLPEDEACAVGDFLSGVSGAFVLIAADPARGSIEVARDHLGSCKVYYRLDGDRLIAASDPAAILRHGAVSADLDEGSIARFLGFRFGLSERSFFRGIRELPPAHCLHVSADGACTQRYWRFGPPPEVALAPDEVAAAFRTRLGRALSDEIMGLEPRQVALSLSGGLDSTALAALAPPGVQAFSWTFGGAGIGDERPRIEQVSRHLELPVRWVSGDGLHPLCDGFADRFAHENSPYLNPFSALKQRLYETAREDGCVRVLVGDGGDALFAASGYWLRDALRTRHPGALRSLVGTLGRTLQGDRFSRCALRRALLPARLPSPLRRRPSPWLTDAARDLLAGEPHSPILPGGGEADRHELSVGIRHSELESEEQRLFAGCGVERANPFWSWPLLELTIHLPAFWYHRDTRSKVLTREALRGLLPEEVLEGCRTGLLGDFFLRGLELRRPELLDTVFRKPLSDWPRYVRREWVEPYLSATRSIGFGHTILWRVIAYELWHRRLLRRDRGDATSPVHERPDRRVSSEDPGDADLVGFVHGVKVRGRFPAPFGSYLLPAAGDGVDPPDALELGYRRIDELPEVEEIWSSQEAATDDASEGHRFAVFRQDDGFGLLVSDRGRGLFRCSRRRVEVEWEAGGTGAAHYFFSYALPLWLEFRGVPVLHGSVISIEDRAVGLVGPSGVGKSVLATDLLRRGCGFLSDDGLVLRRSRSGHWHTSPGPPVLRLWPSALRLLEIAPTSLPRVHETLEKRLLTLRDAGDFARGIRATPASGVRLAALYVLDRRPEADRVTISGLAPHEALVRLIEHSVAAAPAVALGLSARRFQLLADVVGNLPVRHLLWPGGARPASQIRDAILHDLARTAPPSG